MRYILNVDKLTENIQKTKPNDRGCSCISMTYLAKPEGTMIAPFLPSGGGGGGCGQGCLALCMEQKYRSTSTGANTLCTPSLRKNTDPLCTCEVQ